jgi:hypothetical protein
VTDTLFSQAEVTNEANMSIGEFDPNTDYVSQLVGEGKKYSDAQKLAFSALKKDEHIGHLHKEQAELRSELKARITVEDALKAARGTSPDNDTRQPSGSEGNQPSAISEEEVAKIVEGKLSAYAAERTKAENLAYVAAELRKSFGDDYKPKLIEITNALKVDNSFMDNLAATNPTAFLRMVGAGDTPTRRDTSTPARSTVNTGSFVQSGPREKKWSDFEKLRRESPTLYFQPKVQNELMDLVAKHGADFYKS